MNLDQVAVALTKARQLIGHSDYVVIGSLSVLGLAPENAIPQDMAMSIDIDCYTKADPGRIFAVQDALGEHSAFRARYGYFVDPVSPRLPTLPEGWEGRLVCVERAPVRIWFLDANDAAVSKYARCEPRDQRWIRAGLVSGFVSLPVVKARLRSTTFLDAEEEQRARAQVQHDAAWFDALAQGRTVRARAHRP